MCFHIIVNFVTDGFYTAKLVIMFIRIYKLFNLGYRSEVLI